MNGGTLLISDIDGTLLGDDAASARFTDWFAARRERITLAYATGRLFESVQGLVRSGQLPAPEYVIGGVGTQLRRFACGSAVPGWETSARSAWDASVVRSALRSFPNLKPQPAEFQSPHKASYFLPGASEAELNKTRQLLAAEGLEAEIVYSSARDLDVLPAGMHKGGAAEFISQLLADSCVRTIVSGDSGNDLTLFRPKFLGVVVANAHPELRALDGRHVYHSPHAHADGVRDGVEFWLRSASSAG